MVTALTEIKDREGGIDNRQERTDSVWTCSTRGTVDTHGRLSWLIYCLAWWKSMDFKSGSILGSNHSSTTS